MDRKALRPGKASSGDAIPMEDAVFVPPAGDARGEEFVGRPLDNETIAQLYNALAVKLLRVLTVQLGLHRRPEIVEDAVAETFAYLTLRAQEGRPLKIEKDAFAWLVTGVERRIAEKQEQEAAEATEGDAALRPAEASTPDRAQRRPLSIMVSAEELDVVAQAAAGLNEKERRALDLVSNEELDLQTVAERLGISYDDARKSYSRGKRKLQDARGRWSTTFLQEADSYTYAPRTRKAALQAIRMLPTEECEILLRRYVVRTSPDAAARSLGLSSEAYAERLRHAEELFAKRFGMKIPDDLEAVLRKD